YQAFGIAGYNIKTLQFFAGYGDDCSFIFVQHFQLIQQTVPQETQAAFRKIIIYKLMYPPVFGSTVNQVGSNMVDGRSGGWETERSRVGHDAGIQAGSYIFIDKFWFLHFYGDEVINQLCRSTGIDAPVPVI